MTEEEIKLKMRHFLVERSEFVKNHGCQDDTPLFAEGILDSLAFIELVSFAEDTFQIDLTAYEINTDSFGTLNQIAKIVLAAQAKKK